MSFEPVLLRNAGHPEVRDIDGYLARGGYQGLTKAVKELSPAQVIEMVKSSGLRGRGGAGFPTGNKWSFIPADPKLTRYVVCNADESEPGTFKDRALLQADPHQLVEGIAIASYAIGCQRAFVYMRGEFAEEADLLERAIGQAMEKGYLGRKILGTDFALEITLFRGAGAYICGEETALLESLEGKRPMPRSKPPFPAIAGLYASPTVVNNVETLVNVPHIIVNGPEWYASIGVPPRNTGPKIYCLSGLVKRPGWVELPLGVTARELIEEHGGGLREGRRLKAFIPGGSSAALLTPEHLDTPMEYDTLMKIGSMLGSAGVIVMDDSVCIPHAMLRTTEFYYHESCGKCTPCREGTFWMVKVLSRIVDGAGTSEDIDRVLAICEMAHNNALCALLEGAIAPLTSSIHLFRDEFEYHVRHGRCPT
ncbi:MAG: NADH oxidoreductase (quinone) subunit F [Chloroflexota bacterium]|nr:MAG: NADH oxidoreductase (quinone) subunit F [Chloroflexota bacterium]